LLRRLDHGTIYVFIAASYTPIALVLHGSLAWIMLIVAWVGAATGIGLKTGLAEGTAGARLRELPGSRLDRRDRAPAAHRRARTGAVGSARRRRS